MKVLRTIDRALGWASRFTVTAAGVLLVILVLATTLDVVSRAFMNRGISGVVEFSELAMIPLVFLTFGWNERSNSHISVDILTQFTSARTQTIAFSIGRVIALVALTFLTIATASAAMETLMSNQAHYNATYLVYWPFHFAVPLGFGLLTLEVLLSQLRQFTRLWGVDDTPALPNPISESPLKAGVA